MLDQLLAGHYQVLKVLGAGGFGQTYVAQDIHRPGNPTCVVKHLKPANTEPAFLEAARHLFAKEAEALEQLGHHAHIPRLLAYFEENEEFYLVQELIDGNLLSTELLPGYHWSESQVVQLLREILDILDFVHSNGVIHRDVKPNNIIRRQQDNKLVLVDFGVVKQINMQLTTAQSQMSTSVVVGTLGYMPPEQLRGKPRFSSDIYALGIIAIQALTGLNHQQLREDASGEVEWYSYAQVSPELAGILSKMVRYHFQERYESAKEVLAALETLVVQLGYATTQPDFRLQYPHTEPYSCPPTVPVSQFGQQPLSTTANNPRLSTAPTLNLPASPNSPQSAGFAKALAVIKSPVGVILSLATFVSILGVSAFDWHKNQNFLASVQDIKTLKQAKKYEECIQKASNIGFPDKNSSRNLQVKNELINTLNECRISQAKILAAQSNFPEAIKQADKILSNQPFSEEAQNLINEWSQKLLTLATQKYEQSGDVDNAILIAKDIPSKSSSFKEAQEFIAKWKQEFNSSKENLNLAQIALTKNKFNDAITSASKIAGTQYWRQQKEAIIQEAKSKLEPDNIKPFYSVNTTVVRNQLITPRVAPTIRKRNNSNLNVSSNNSQPVIRTRKLKSQPSPTQKSPTIDNCQASSSILGQGSNCQ
ncbi:serine/threonine protein kinase [Nostoc sp. UCD121]|uniref:serine/threonine-protein kinase n=1 Tax=unclassified Nostoc TaxID=2593658 RepID=UPI0016275948|nr:MULTISPECIES: serine/threonine-protein kinase [unclassified Nostoc]MBC1223269.1 serine/threonine protein kinase [Nostoc sp. UCD120]MBC1278537.1 serine/threonine protein kinase [Nostoc sp. UCD121]